MLFRNSLAGNRDMYLASVFPENDKIKITSMQIGNEHWKFNACPMDGGMLAVDTKGVVSTVWRRGREIFTATNDGADEQLIGIGEQPWIASTTDGPMAVWTSRRDGELMLKNVSKENVLTITSIARDPVVVADPVHGKSVFVFWEENDSGRTSIFVKAIELGSLR